jgi:hypothetical protein
VASTSDIREFLTSRRAKITPEQAGLPAYGNNRRVKGLRREEVAFPDWEKIANDAVAILRAEAGRDPYDKALSQLIGELSTGSDEFRVRWAAHNVKFHRSGAKTLHHPVVGDLTLDYEAMDLPGDTGQRILVYSAEPASPSQQSLDLLASWTTTPTSRQADEPAAER